jgi:hypothetical protein
LATLIFTDLVRVKGFNDEGAGTPGTGVDEVRVLESVWPIGASDAEVWIPQRKLFPLGYRLAATDAGGRGHRLSMRIGGGKSANFFRRLAFESALYL